MEEKIKELYNFYLKQKLDMIFDNENKFSESSPIIEKYREVSQSRRFHNGYSLVIDLGKYNYQNLKGEILSDEWFDAALDFDNGTALVRNKVSKNYPLSPIENNVKSNAIDTNGKLLGDKWFDVVQEVGDIFAFNYVRGPKGIVHGDVKLLRRKPLRSYDPGHKIVQINGKYNYKRQSDNKLILEENVDELFPYYDGFALVKNNGKYNLIDVDGNYLSKDLWFDKIVNRTDSFKDDPGKSLTHLEPYRNGYVKVLLGDKYNYLDFNGNLVFEWLSLNHSDTLDKTIRFIDLKGFKIIKETPVNFVITNDKETFNLKYRPLRMYDDYILCCRKMLFNHEYEYFLYDKHTKKYNPVGKSFERENKDLYWHCYFFDDNFIHDYHHEKTYFIYHEQIIDITNYYKEKLRHRKSVKVDKQLSRILSLDEFHFENIEEINKAIREEKERQRKEEENKKDRDLLARIDKKMSEIEEEEALRKKSVEVLQKEIEMRLQILDDYSKKGLTKKINYDKIFKRVNDEDGYHYEFADFILKNNRIRMFNLASATFENTKADHLDFRGSNPIGMQPTKVYKKSLRGSNFMGIHFDPLIPFTGVDIRECTFGEDDNPLTMNVMPNFKDAIYDETTIYNGVSLTKLIKKEEEILDNDTMKNKGM